MNTLVLVGLALVVAGFVLLAVRFAPRVRRQFAATAVQPRTVADLVRLREQTTASAVQPAPSAAPRRVTAAPAAPSPTARPEPPAPRVAPVTAAAPAPPAPEPPAPAFVPPPPRPTPVAGRVRRESAEPPAPSLDGDNSPWQRGARMAVGLGGGQPWREPPAPPAPLRIVPSAQPAAPVEAAAPAPEAPAEPEAPASVRLVPAEPELEDTPEEPIDATAPDTAAEEAPVRLLPADAGRVEQQASPVPAEPAAPRQAVWVEPAADAAPNVAGSAEPAVSGTSAEQASVEPVPVEEPASPVPAEPVAPRQAVWIEPGAVAAPDTSFSAEAAATGTSERENAKPAESEPTEGEIPISDGWDDIETEDVPAGAVPDRFAEEQPLAADAEAGPRRNRQTPDERAAEQAAADLALLRTFGFVDPAMRPDSAPVVEMERPDEQEPPVDPRDAQPVRYRVIRRDGSGVGGATVTLLDDRGGDVAAGAADAEGRGELLAPSSGGYVLVSTAAGHQPGAVAITVSGAATETDVLIARSASVSGSVHGEDGPVAGARVTLVQDGEAVDAVDTCADGTYRISDIGAGEYGLSVAAAGCEPVATLLDVAEEADVRHDVVLEPASPVADGELVEDDAMSGLR